MARTIIIIVVVVGIAILMLMLYILLGKKQTIKQYFIDKKFLKKIKKKG